MATYCISDIHGHYDEFIELLELINFQKKDELYILGDIIDRGLQSAEMLWYATEQAPANAHFLLGNHEDMMNAACDDNELMARMGDSWSYNYGYETIQQIKSFDKYYDGWDKKILDWSRNLPYFYDINVNGRRFVLVHAGHQSQIYDHPDDWTAGGQERPLIAIEDCPLQDRQALIWNRTSWILGIYEWPFDVVCGHTPVCEIMNMYLNFPKEQRVKGGILHLNCRKHFIDCGVNRGGYLAALRLDDMEEFYVKGRNESYNCY